MNLNTWGKSWTYALLAVFLFLGYIITWIAVEDKRDQDAETWKLANHANVQQMAKLKGYILAMQGGADKTNLEGILDSIYILTSQADLTQLDQVLDSLRLVDTDTITTNTGTIISEIIFQNNKYTMTIEGLDPTQEQCFQTNVLMNAIEQGAVDVTNEICIPAQN